MLSFSPVCTNRANVCFWSTSFEPLVDDKCLELNQLSGIAAILTFPLDVEVVEAEEQEAQKEQDDSEDKEEG